MLLFLLALLICRIRISVSLSTTLRGGSGVLLIRVLGVQVRFPLRIHGLEEPRLSLELLHGSGGRRSLTRLMDRTKREPPKWLKAFLHAHRIERIAVSFTVGVDGDPSVTALLCGAVANLAESALACLPPVQDTRVRAAPAWHQDVFRINLEGMICVRPVKIIKEKVILKGEKN